MGGTLALWYDEWEEGAKRILSAQRMLGAEHPGDVRPKVELHFNLWRDLSSSIETNFLDIGIRFKTPIEAVKQFYLYIPDEIRHDHLSDLSPALKQRQTLDTVFNAVVQLGNEGEGYFTTTSSGKHFTTVHSISFGVDGDVKVEHIEGDNGDTGSRLIFTEKFCGRIRTQQSVGHANSYIRFRLQLKGDSRELFSQEVNVDIPWTVPLIGRIELTEFRLNEKRSYPSSIADMARGGQFFISNIHYFLIRDLRHELTMQHKQFRKVRRLEGHLWQHYLLNNADEKRAAKYTKIANRMVIYHWREDARDSMPVEDFVAFASFRSSAPNIMLYFLLAVLLGALGSTASTGASKWVEHIGVGTPAWAWRTWSWETKILMGVFVLASAFYGLPYLRRAAQAVMARWRHPSKRK